MFSFRAIWAGQICPAFVCLHSAFDYTREGSNCAGSTRGLPRFPILTLDAVNPGKSLTRPSGLSRR